jgi:hypothetical protein
MSKTSIYQGGCFCGAVRYAAQEVFDAGYCHCTVCRRISGAPAAAWFNVREEHFRVASGKPAALQSSEHFVRYFCAACGTHLFGRDDLPTPTTVGSETVEPQIHQWWSDHVSWYENAADLQKFDTGTISHPAKRKPAKSKSLDLEPAERKPLSG